MAAISIVLKAVDQYSGVITGLNQGFDLVGKAIDVMKTTADIAFAAMAKGAELVGKTIDLAALGGAYEENYRQFENYAKSFDKVGSDILDTVQRISSNTITKLQSIPIATKAIASRLTGDDLEKVLTYAKKWSEAYGGSYEAAAEKIFNAFSTGKFSPLKQMGLVIEKGASTAKVLETITTDLKRFGETGFNTADKLDSLTVSSADFWTKIGQSLNNSKVFEVALGGLADTYEKFVKAIDATPITQAMDAVFYATGRMYNAVANTGVVKIFAEIIMAIQLGTLALVESVGSATIKAVKIARDAVAAVATIMRDNPNLNIGAGTYLDAENLAKAEVSLNKFVKESEASFDSLKNGLTAPAKAMTGAMNEALTKAKDFRFNLTEVPKDMDAIVQATKKIPDELQRLYDLQDSRAAAGLDVRTGKPIAGTETTALEKAVAGKDSSIASLLSTSLPMESILQALGKFLLDTVMGTASAEKMQLTTITTAI